MGRKNSNKDPRQTIPKSLDKKNKQSLEKIDWKIFSPNPIVGVDEVGRGCLAGPVFAAAVCLKSDQLIEQLTDSKILSEKRRDVLAPLIEREHWVGVGFASVEEVDQINILQASFLAMKRAIHELERKMGLSSGVILVDGHMKIPGVQTKQVPLVKGDLRCAPISAASIVAKVARDGLMKELGEKYPLYGFEKHKGYAAPIHKKAIQSFGPCEIHRKTFSGVKEFLSRP